MVLEIGTYYHIWTRVWVLLTDAQETSLPTAKIATVSTAISYAAFNGNRMTRTRTTCADTVRRVCKRSRRVRRYRRNRPGRRVSRYVTRARMSRRINTFRVRWTSGGRHADFGRVRVTLWDAVRRIGVFISCVMVFAELRSQALSCNVSRTCTLRAESRATRTTAKRDGTVRTTYLSPWLSVKSFVRRHFFRAQGHFLNST